MGELSKAQQRDRARRAFRSVARHTARLSARIERLVPGAFDKSGNDDPAPEVIIGLGQANIYAHAVLTMSDAGVDDMLERHVRPTPEVEAHE